MRCLNCRRSSEYEICSHCWEFAILQLKTFPNRYKELEKELLPSQGARNDRVSGSKTAPIPVRLETLYLRSGGISQALMTHETVIRHLRKETRITFRGDEQSRIIATCEYHIVREQWTYSNYSDAATLAKEIIQISNKIKYVLGHISEEIVIGKCPTIKDDGQPCGASLKVDPAMKLSDIKCRSCDTVWDSTKWRLLGRMLDA